jgi:hypothetical protein
MIARYYQNGHLGGEFCEVINYCRSLPRIQLQCLSQVRVRMHVFYEKGAE